MSRLIWGVSYIQVDRWIEGQDLESRLEVKAWGGCGFGELEVRSFERSMRARWLWTLMQVKGVLM